MKSLRIFRKLYFCGIERGVRIRGGISTILIGIVVYLINLSLMNSKIFYVEETD